MPRDKDLKQLPVEDAGVSFEPMKTETSTLQEFPYLIRKHRENQTP